MKPWEKPVKLTTYNFKGELYPFQHQGSLFLAGVKNCLLTDQTGLGKTVQCIAAYDVLKHKHPDLQVVIFTLASVQLQWVDFFKRFLPSARAEAVIGTPRTREKIYEDFFKGKVDAIILNYNQTLRDACFTDKATGRVSFNGPLLDALKTRKYILILDEVQRCKNVSSKTSKAMTHIRSGALGVKAMTATPVYTHLVDIYGIFKIIEPSIFKNKESFKKDFCILDYTFSPYGQIIGYRNHEQLKNKIKDFVFGRAKSEVAKELPPLVTKDIFIDLPNHHKEVYDKIEDQIDLLDETREKEKIASMVQAQVCVNALETVKDYKGGKVSHPKLDEIERLITEELVGEKIVIYSRFLQTINILFNKFSKKANIFRITGVESQLERAQNLKMWAQSENGGIMLITNAGGAGLNLQAAGTLIMVDRPWSSGEVDQLRGRIHRIGSQYSSLLEINLIARGTIDEYVLDSLRDKRSNVEKVFGQADSPISIKDILEKRSVRKS